MLLPNYFAQNSGYIEIFAWSWARLPEITMFITNHWSTAIYKTVAKYHIVVVSPGCLVWRFPVMRRHGSGCHVGDRASTAPPGRDVDDARPAAPLVWSHTPPVTVADEWVCSSRRRYLVVYLKYNNVNWRPHLFTLPSRCSLTPSRGTSNHLKIVYSQIKNSNQSHRLDSTSAYPFWSFNNDRLGDTFWARLQHMVAQGLSQREKTLLIDI